MKHCVMTGNTTRDVEMRYSTSDGNMAIGRFSLAVNSGYGDKKKTEFFNFTAFGKTAETMEKYVPKGTKIIVECEPTQNQYTDKNGNKVNDVGFVVKSFEFAGAKSENSQSGSNQPTSKPMPSGDGFMNIPDGIDEELPFR